MTTRTEVLREARSWGLRRAGGSQPDCAVFQTPSWLIFLSACLLPTSVTFPIPLQIKPFWPQEVSSLTDHWHFAVIVLPLFWSYCNFLGNSFSWLFSEAKKQSFCAQQFPQICELKHDTLTNDTVLRDSGGWLVGWHWHWKVFMFLCAPSPLCQPHLVHPLPCLYSTL